MSATEAVLRKLQEALPGTRLCKDVLVLAPMERILRGFTFERTIEKGRYYFWYVVIPLYTPLDFFALDGSKRFHDPVYLRAENVDEVSRHLHRIIMDGHLELLRNVCTPKDFLAYGKASDGTVYIYEALTHYVLGNVSRCRNTFRKRAEELRLADSKTTAIRELIRFFDELDSRPESAARRIKRWERASIETFGLADVMSGENWRRPAL